MGKTHYLILLIKSLHITCECFTSPCIMSMLISASYTYNDVTGDIVYTDGRDLSNSGITVGMQLADSDGRHSVSLTSIT